MGAALEVERYGLFARVASLPDLPALTAAERKVVVASAHPLRAILPLLVSRGARIVLLPIDGRPVDLPELAPTGGARFYDDHRAMDALGDLAMSDSMLAIARIEELLDVASEHGFVFAHELAHLAYFVLPT